MENLKIKDTLNAPEICFDAENNILEIKGESYPENARAFYKPVMEWVKEYIDQLGEQSVRVDVELKYFNSSTAKILMNFFDTLDGASSQGKHIRVNWIYDQKNLNAVEYGEDFQEDLEFLIFNLVPKK